MKKILFALLFSSLACYSQDSLFVDCYGTPSPENWLGDGYCDDGSYSWGGNPIYFDCEEFGYDLGDCEIPMEEGVYGCTDPEAVNYNPLAEIDNGGCANVACEDGEAKMLFEITLDQYPSETGWILTDISNGQPIASVSAGEYSYEQSNTTIPYQFCVPETGVELILSDIYGDGMAGSLWGGIDGNFIILADLEPCGSPDIIWELPDANFGGAAYSGPIWLENCEVPIEYGCTDNSYIEFNPTAQVDDGSCESLHTLGCINWTSFNYNPEATLNEIIPVCDYTLIIEDDAADGWGDSYLAVTQEDSIIGVYTIGPGEYFQEFNIQLETDKAVNVYYFEVGGLQQPQAEVEFQTMHNSFEIINSNDVLLIQGGVFPFANNGAGALQAFEPPFWHVYSAMPYCGDYCIPTIVGCMDEEAFNYNIEANTDSDDCTPVVEGCTNDLAFNYNPSANIDDNSCESYVYGCMDSLAWNYNFLANSADESCLYFGCMDPLADNYDPIANVELEGACFTTVLGCTDPEAFNYNEDANTEDFSCIPFIYGCMDSTAFNYNPLANTDDECILIVEGCMDVNAYNYDVFANTEAECLYDAGCVGEPGEPYWLNDTCYAWVIMIDPYCCNNEWDTKCQELYWSCEGDSGLDIEDLLQNNALIVYPNPTESILNVISKDGIEVKLFDVIGNLIVTTTENQIDMSKLSKGTYIINIKYRGEIINKKVIKR